MLKNSLVVFVLLVLVFSSCGGSKKAAPSAQATTVEKASKNHKQTLVDNKTFVVNEMATDPSYGYSEKNAVEVGGAKNSEGPTNERRYLNALTGPNGEAISYYREGSCCPVKSENGMMGMAMLDNYRVWWQGAKDTVSIYINMYDSSILKAPNGFGLKHKN